MAPNWYLATAAVAIFVYLGLAAHVVTRNPRKLISWLFGALCLAAVNHYLTNLYLLSMPEVPLSAEIPFPLRWKWALGSFVPTLNFHMVAFFFPFAWRRARRWILLPAYACSGSLALAALFTDLLVAAAPQAQPALHVTGAVPGPLMIPFGLFFALAMAGGSVGLIAGYRSATWPSQRQQILHLIAPTGLMILTSLLHWSNALTSNTGRLPQELDNAAIILAGFLYAWGVLHYGSIVGHPTTLHDLFHSLFGAALGLAALFVTLALDMLLAASIPFPYPLITGTMIVFLTVSFPVTRPWVTRQLDSLLFRSERQRQAMIHQLVNELAKTPDAKRLQVEFLGALCATLGVSGGYVAVAEPNSATGTLIVRAIQGKPSVQPGDLVHWPPLVGTQPQLAAAVLTELEIDPGWRGVSLFCPITTNSSSDGLLALGKKQDGKPFTARDLTLCNELARRLDTIEQMERLREQRNHYLEAAHQHDQALQQLKENVTSSAQRALSAWERSLPSNGRARLKISVLGPLNVMRGEQPVSETDWGTEKAKAMLAYLLWKGPVGATREELSEALWPHRPAVETANVFHVTLFRLRRSLELEPSNGRRSRYILYKRGRYRFNANAPHWLDVTAFRALASQNDPQGLREAIELYRGTYLEDMRWTFPPEVEAEQRALERLYADALRRLAAQTRGQEAAPYLVKLLIVEPADETAHRAMVFGYLSQGRRDLAERQVNRWRETLVELDLEPSSEILALWHRVENKR